MKKTTMILGIVMTYMMSGLSIASAADVEHSATGAGGYDFVSYRTGEKPLPGNGNHLSEVDGVTYLFINDENKRRFDRNPEKYLPAYGGFCAFGV